MADNNNETTILHALSNVGNTVANLKNAFAPSGGLSWSDIEKNEALMGAQWRENERVYRMQRGDYLSDLEDERRYNSAAAQVERLREAGLNPALVFGDGNFGSQSQAPVAGTPASGSAPSADPSIQVRSEAWTRLGDIIGGSVGAFYDNIIKKEAAREAGSRADVAEIDARYAAQEKIAQLEKLLEDKNRSFEERQAIRQNIMFLQSTFDERKRQLMLGNTSLEYQLEVAQQQRDLLHAQVIYQKLENDNYYRKLNISEKSAQAALMGASASLQQAAVAALRQSQDAKESNARIDLIASQVIDQLVTTDGKRIDNVQKKELYPIVYKTLDAQYDNILIQTRQAEQDYNNPYQYYSPAIPFASGVVRR